MPLVAHNDLPSFKRLEKEGYTILPEGRALQQDIREMHIGLLNMMPCAALEAAERQFMRLIGNANQVTQIYIHPFSFPEIHREDDARAYIEKHYESFEDIKAQGLDALIITGANIDDPDLNKNDFCKPLQEVLNWAWNNVTSTICSCLATHAVMQFNYNQHRTAMGKKLWGVFPHRVLRRSHPLVNDMNTIFDVPHSRWNNISAEQFETVNMDILVASEEAGVHMATSRDGFRMICFQGHPEYDTESLMKEYKREVTLYAEGEREDYPPFPFNVLSPQQKSILATYKSTVKQGQALPDFPTQIEQMLENTWRDSAKTVIGKWIGLVYQTTNVDRKKQFMDGIDPENPLDLRQHSKTGAAAG